MFIAKRPETTQMYIHTMVYYSVIKRYEVLKPTTIWMNNEDSKQSKRSQTKKKYHVLFDSFCMKYLQQENL